MCLLWSHSRHINPVKIHPERITQKDKELASDLNYDGIEYPSKFVLLFFVMKIN